MFLDNVVGAEGIFLVLVRVVVLVRRLAKVLLAVSVGWMLLSGIITLHGQRVISLHIIDILHARERLVAQVLASNHRGIVAVIAEVNLVVTLDLLEPFHAIQRILLRMSIDLIQHTLEKHL